jgi:hypothetical protein
MMADICIQVIRPVAAPSDPWVIPQRFQNLFARYSSFRVGSHWENAAICCRFEPSDRS